MRAYFDSWQSLKLEDVVCTRVSQERSEAAVGQRPPESAAVGSEGQGEV